MGVALNQGLTAATTVSTTMEICAAAGIRFFATGGIGGIHRGYVHGASDKNGAYPDHDPVRPDDLAATMFHQLGIPHDIEVRDQLNRPLPIAAGRPIRAILS